MVVRVITLAKHDDILHELGRIDVDPAAYEIFRHKALYKILKLDGLTCAQANVLKQIALVCGADCAIPRTVYHGRRKKKVPVLLMANLRELQKISERLKEQTWMLSIREALDTLFNNHAPATLKIRNRCLSFSRTYIMGVINITPDSFYDGSRFTIRDTILRVAEEMESEGADFLDIGAESSRPGAGQVNTKDEIERLKPVLSIVTKRTRIPVSIDTYKAEVAAFAIDNGVKIVNDISGLRLDRKMAKVIARSKTGLVIMHMRGVPTTMQDNPHYVDLMAELHSYFQHRIDYALQKGIDKERIIIDPGLGFGKRLEDNYEIINRLKELQCFTRPVLVGHSRKSFIGKPFNIKPEQRLEGTLGVEALLIKNGAHIIRVHDVLEAKKVAQLVDTIIS